MDIKTIFFAYYRGRDIHTKGELLLLWERPLLDGGKP